MQAKLGESAIEKVEAAKAREPVKLLLLLSDLLLADDEKERLRKLGGEILCDSARVVAVKIPGRYLLDLAELPSVIKVE